MLKKFIDIFLSIYLWPLRVNKRLYFYVLDIFFSPSSLHINRAANYINARKKTGFNLILDVGCHQEGFISDFLVKFPTEKIIGFEPNIIKYESARNKFIHNNRVEIINLALGKEAGKATLNITNHDYSSSLMNIEIQSSENSATFQIVNKQECSVMPLDSEIPENESVLFMKIDTQGYELEVLKGASSVLRRTQFVLLELANHSIYLDAPKYHEIDEYLRQQNFRLVQIYSPLSDATEYDALYENSI